MKSIFNVSDEEAKRIRNLHEVAGVDKKISSVLNEENVLNDETTTNIIISEGPFSGRGVIAKLCCSATALGYWSSTCPLPPQITANNGNRGAMYLNINKTTIGGNTPSVGQYFRAVESQGGTPTGNGPNGESSGLIYQVTSTSGWNPIGSTVNFPNASGCPNCPPISTWSCNVSGSQGVCTEVPTNCADHATEQDCQNSADPLCGGNQTTYNCNNGTCVQVQGQGGQYSSYSQCQQNCQQPVVTYSCNNGSCVQVQGAGGQFTTLANCQGQCDPLPSITYDCSANGSCVPVQGAGGQYLTMSDCTEGCTYEGNWRCKNYDQEPQLDVMQPIEDVKSPRELYEQIPTSGYHCIKDPNGPYQSKWACESKCGRSGDRKIDCINCEKGVMTQVSPPDECPRGFSPVTSLTQGPCTECQQAGCINVGWGYGQGLFNSMAECQQSNCQPPTNYACVNGNCLPDPNGPFTSSALCQQNCPAGGNTYDCNGSTPFGPPSACVQVSGSGGQFATLDDCMASPCACDDVISVWPLYTNNPNIGAGSGTWYGSPHDGPSNPNAIQGQLNNLTSNPNYPGGNPVQQHKMKCKEAAMNFWLGNSTNIACCADPGFAVGASNADPLGCVTSSFMSMINGNFANNHAGWPSQGCNWLNNALASAQSQQAQYNSGSGAYCKLQGKINFLNNFIATAQSTYITFTPVFTPGC